MAWLRIAPQILMQEVFKHALPGVNVTDARMVNGVIELNVQGYGVPNAAYVLATVHITAPRVELTPAPEPGLSTAPTPEGPTTR